MSSCKNTKRASNVDNSLIKNELIVALKKDVSPDRFTNRFRVYDMKKLKAINKSMNIWLFTYNTELVVPEKALEKVRLSTAVKSAEFNKNIALRKR